MSSTSLESLAIVVDNPAGFLTAYIVLKLASLRISKACPGFLRGISGDEQFPALDFFKEPT